MQAKNQVVSDDFNIEILFGPDGYRDCFLIFGNFCESCGSLKKKVSKHTYNWKNRFQIIPYKLICVISKN